MLNRTTDLCARARFSAVLAVLLLSNWAGPLLAQSAPAPLPPMPADANPAFEVATIKASDTSAPHGTFIRHNGRQIIAYNMSVGQLITYAYSLHTSQIADGPPSLLATHSISMASPTSMAIPTSARRA